MTLPVFISISMSAVMRDNLPDFQGAYRRAIRGITIGSDLVLSDCAVAGHTRPLTDRQTHKKQTDTTEIIYYALGGRPKI